MIDDPRLVLLRRRLERRPAVSLPREDGYREAAVAVVLRPRAELELLLIKRAEQATDPWSGHMALPGGRREAGDADLRATAERETAEETGIELARTGELLGALDEVQTRHERLPRLVIAPFVLGVPADASASPEPQEVEAALWVPLSALRAEGAVGELVVELESGSLSFPSIRYGVHTIWGLTHRILMQFLEVAGEAGV
jgi:8-oxo-dGTP pyrophosphatase MutT (NUDIX family)